MIVLEALENRGFFVARWDEPVVQMVLSICPSWKHPVTGVYYFRKDRTC
jgi:hypothetical protein